MSRRSLDICTDRSADELRRLARKQGDPAASARIYAIANALDGMSRAEAARLAGMERQALHDAVVRYNAEGLEGLHDRPRSGRKPRLNEAERPELAKLIKDGPDVEASGLSAWTLADLCAEIKQRWAKTLHPASLSRVVRKLGFSRQKARQVHPQERQGSSGSFPKRGLPTAVDAARAAHPGKRLTLWFEDEARVGQKGRTCHWSAPLRVDRIRLIF